MFQGDGYNFNQCLYMKVDTFDRHIIYMSLFSEEFLIQIGSDKYDYVGRLHWTFNHVTGCDLLKTRDEWARWLSISCLVTLSHSVTGAKLLKEHDIFLLFTPNLKTIIRRSYYKISRYLEEAVVSLLSVPVKTFPQNSHKGFYHITKHENPVRFDEVEG